MTKIRTALMGAALLAVTACAGGTITNPSQSRNTDPMLKSILASFQSGCIANAPGMNEQAIRAGFARNPPRIAGNMSLIATGKEDTYCSVLVRNYGTNRPAPSYGDVNALLRALQSRVGGTLRPKTAESSGQVLTPRNKYTIGAAIQSNGDLLVVMYY